jgi:tetratricopeptide (TPR) repeat protein
VIRRRLILLFGVSLLLVAPAVAQSRNGNLRVRVSFTDGHPCTIKVHVQLMLSGSNTTTDEGYTNDIGEIEFFDLPVGEYHLVVSGDGIETTDSGIFDVDSRRGSQFQNVTVKRTDEAQQRASAGDPTVAVADMNIPRAARKQFNKATDLIAREDWKKAIDLLNRALAIYPQYAQAYNNLGVVYARLGDRSNEKVALQKALAINDHFAPAWVNLGRMAIAQRDFPNAEGWLDKAAALEPANSQTLLILANVQLMNLHYDLAITTCRKVHSLGQDSHSLVHFIAARAYEHETRIPEAKKELHTFLDEEPDGIRADAARRELTNLQKQYPR